MYGWTMRTNFHRIAYEALDVCNAVRLPVLARAVETTGVRPGDRALDIGTGNGTVAVLLAEAFDLQVVTVEADPVMADLAAARIAASGAAGRIDLRTGTSGTQLGGLKPLDLIVAIGATDPCGDGTREPPAMLAGLSRHLKPGGAILWGDLFWRGDPPDPLRQLVEMNNTYASHEGWQAAARSAGLDVALAEVSDDAAWDDYLATMDRAARDWLAAHPDRPEAAGVRASADRVQTLFHFGRPHLDFGLYVFLRPNDA
jgi:predicted O-methyltransferase YrrM